MRRLALAACIAAALALAGCTRGDEPLVQESVPLGVLDGVVTDAGLVPLAGVNVTVATGNASALTDGAGAFRFVLEPGEHLLVARLDGFVNAAVRANVVAAASVGVNMTLAPVPRESPRTESQEKSGLIGCALLVKNGNAAEEHVCPSEDANARPTLDFEVADLHGLGGAVVELDWTAGSKASEELALSVSLVTASGEEPVGRIEGRAPLSLSLPVRILEAKLQPGAALRVTAGPAGSFLDDESALDAGAALQQPFTAYATLFYHQAPPAGFTVLDG